MKVKTRGPSSPRVYPFARLAKVVLAARARPPLEPLGDSVVAFCVWPGDLDNNLHLNNGRYLTLMDLGRWDLVGRTGLLRAMMQRKWYPVVSSSTIRHRRSLEPFQRYELRTRLLCWDAKHFVIEQRFEREGKLHAIGVIQGVFLAKDGRRVPTQEVVDIIAPGVQSPAAPAWVEAWQKSLEALNAEIAAERTGPARES